MHKFTEVMQNYPLCKTNDLTAIVYMHTRRLATVRDKRYRTKN